MKVETDPAAAARIAELEHRVEQLEALQRSATEDRRTHWEERQLMERAYCAYLHEQDQELETLKELLVEARQAVDDTLGARIDAAVVSIDDALTRRRAPVVRSRLAGRVDGRQQGQTRRRPQTEGRAQGLAGLSRTIKLRLYRCAGAVT